MTLRATRYETHENYLETLISTRLVTIRTCKKSIYEMGEKKKRADYSLSDARIVVTEINIRHICARIFHSRRKRKWISSARGPCFISIHAASKSTRTSVQVRNSCQIYSPKFGKRIDDFNRLGQYRENSHAHMRAEKFCKIFCVFLRSVTSWKIF